MKLDTALISRQYLNPDETIHECEGSVNFAAPCPYCGLDANWWSLLLRITGPRSGIRVMTQTDLHCPNCDRIGA